MYKKVETQKKHDKARNEHIKEIIRLEQELTFIPFGNAKYNEISTKLELYKLQLVLYDGVIYGES